MKQRRVWRYTCEFCGKSNCSAPSISKHEARCTANPNRKCGMCAASEGEQKPIAELISAVRVIDRPVDRGEWTVEGETEKVIDIKALREITGNCPACILAALRQSKIQKWDGDPESQPLRAEFNFKAETKRWWDDFNDAHRECY